MTKVRHPRQVGKLFIDQSLPWGLFDGARKGQNDFSSPGSDLYLSSEYFNNFKAALGVGLNNYAEMMAPHAMQVVFYIFLMIISLILRLVWELDHHQSIKPK